MVPWPYSPQPYSKWVIPRSDKPRRLNLANTRYRSHLRLPSSFALHTNFSSTDLPQHTDIAMGGSDEEGSLKKEKKEKKDKDKDKDKDKKHKDEKKDKGKEKEKDKDEKKDKKDKDGGEKKDKDKKDKDKDKKDKGKDEKGKDEKGKDKEKDKDKKEKKDKKDKKDEDEDEEDGKKKKKDKDKDKAKDKDKKDKPSHPPGVNLPSGPVLGGEAASYYNPSGAPPKPPSQPGHPPQSGEVPWFLREPGTEAQSQPPPRADPPFPNPNPHYTTFQQPPLQQPSRAVGDGGGAQPPQNVPPSGYRIPLDPNSQFPTPDQVGRPPATDFNSSTGPIFIGSAIFPDSVHPCKITPSLHPPCRVSLNGGELEHHGRYDLLPITLDMEWVPTANGQIPPGRRPVEGGYESNGGKLYHALGTIQGVQVPGKAGERIVSRSS